MDFSKGDKRLEECNLLLKRKSSMELCQWDFWEEVLDGIVWFKRAWTAGECLGVCWHEKALRLGFNLHGTIKDCVALCADREGENLAKDTLRTILTSLHLKISCWQGGKMVQPLWKIVWPILKTQLPLQPTDSTPRFKPKRTENLCLHKTCTWT